MPLNLDLTQIVQNDSGQHSLNKWLCVLAATGLTVAFMKQAWSTELRIGSLAEYSFAMVICYAPSYAIKLLEAWKGRKDDKP